MQEATFQIKTHAKCILAGEHAVLRGHPALVMPVPSKAVTLKFFSGSNQQNVAFHHECQSDVLQTIFEKLFTHAIKQVNKSSCDVQGSFVIEDTIPISYGLGFSAALCVSIAKWLCWRHWLEEKNIFFFAKQLEDLCHGKSSGLDIAGVMTDNPVMYSPDGSIQEIKPHWLPKLYLSDTHQSMNTCDCVHHVSALCQKNKALANRIDADMDKAVKEATHALCEDEKMGLEDLKKAIHRANHCFEQWRLINPVMAQHMHALQSSHALAVKPTGSGGGGYILSLWDHAPANDMKFEMIRVC